MDVSIFLHKLIEFVRCCCCCCCFGGGCCYIRIGIWFRGYFYLFISSLLFSALAALFLHHIIEYRRRRRRFFYLYFLIKTCVHFQSVCGNPRGRTENSKNNEGSFHKKEIFYTHWHCVCVSYGLLYVVSIYNIPIFAKSSQSHCMVRNKLN